MEVINATNTTAQLGVMQHLQEITFPMTRERIIDLVQAPWHHPDVVWMVIPLIIVLVLMQFYFGRYKKEEMGWNTAVGNSLVLIFIAIDLFRFLYNNQDMIGTQLVNGIPVKVAVAALVGLEGFTLFFADFFHSLSKNVAFFISSPLQVNLTAYVALMIVYSDIPFDRYTLFAACILFAGLYALFTLLKAAIPEAREIVEEAKI